MSDDPDKPPKKKPKTKTQPVKGGGSGSGSPPRKTSIGYGGGGEPPKFYPGQSLACRVVRIVASGVYLVTVLKYDFEAHLFTEHSYAPGDEIIAQFYQWQHGILALKQGEPAINWLEPFPHPDSKSKKTEKKRKAKTFDRKESQSQLRRAYDLIMPPLDDNSISIRIADYELDWLISDVESAGRTGCIKVDCEKTRSRGAILLYRGRAVGCMSCSEANPETEPTEEALNAILRVMHEPETKVTLYDLPEDIVLSMSALFLGYPVQRDDEYTSMEYCQYILDWLEKEKGTATLVLSFAEDMCLAFVYKGEFAGAFSINSQYFMPDRELFYSLLQVHNLSSTLGISLLPSEMTSGIVQFGFSLSNELKRIRGEDAS